MASTREKPELRPPGSRIRRIGVVVHPARAIEKPLRVLREWTAAHGAALVQVEIPESRRTVTEEGRPEDCDLIVAIGGDGTMLAAAHVASEVHRPVLGVACGSLGALTSVAADGLSRALDRFERQDWIPRRLPALDVRLEGGGEVLALNDLAIVRAGQGQIRTTATVDESLFARLAGDGCIVSTAIGSSAYALAAGGPLLAPGADAFLLTPLAAHGGSCPPLVIGAHSRLGLDINVGHGGARVELDGQITDLEPGVMRISLRRDVATVVGFADQESILAGLRRRQIIIDSPRILADKAQT